MYICSLDLYGVKISFAATVLNDSSNKTSKIIALNIFRNVLTHVGMQVIMKEVFMIISDLPSGKSSGFDGLNSESLKQTDPLVCLLLSICFTCMYTHCYMTSSMIKSIIVPLVKNKCGNLADRNNYRPIALSSIYHQKSLNMSFCFALKTMYGLTIINLDSSLHFPLIFVFCSYRIY